MRCGLSDIEPSLCSSNRLKEILNSHYPIWHVTRCPLHCIHPSARVLYNGVRLFYAEYDMPAVRRSLIVQYHIQNYLTDMIFQERIEGTIPNGRESLSTISTRVLSSHNGPWSLTVITCLSVCVLADYHQLHKILYNSTHPRFRRFDVVDSAIWFGSGSMLWLRENSCALVSCEISNPVAAVLEVVWKLVVHF